MASLCSEQLLVISLLKLAAKDKLVKERRDQDADVLLISIVGLSVIYFFQTEVFFYLQTSPMRYFSTTSGEIHIKKTLSKL